MRIQHCLIILSAFLLILGLVMYDKILVIVAFSGIMVSGWGFVYPERANVWVYRVQSNFAKEKIEKELKEYTGELRRAEGYIVRFAETFDLKFPLQWTLDERDKIIPSTVNELSEEQLKEPFVHFQELLLDEGIDIPEYLVKLYINYKIDCMRYAQFETFIESCIEGNRSAANVVRAFARQIGTTSEEMQYMKKIFVSEYLLKYLVKNFSKEDLQLQLNLDVSEMEKAMNSIQIALQGYARDLERERRVNTMRGILYGKIQPSVHKTIADWEVHGQKLMEGDVKQLFTQMGYEVKEPSSRGQGIDMLLKKINHKIAVKCVLASAEIAVSSKQIQEAFVGKSYWDCQSCIVVTNGSFSEESLELAEKLHIEIWDGKMIQKLIDKYWNNDIEYWKLLQHKQGEPSEEKEPNVEVNQSLAIL